MDEMQIVLGANYDDKLYIGASFDVLFASYSQESDYAEKDRDNSLAQFNEMTLHEEFKTSGFGVNGKFGIIYLPTNKIRLSAALHTPTVFSFSDTYSTAITSDLFLPQYGGAIKETKSSPTGTYSYKFSTPLRANIGGAYVFGKSGLISAELEWVDYRTAAFNFTGDKVHQREINGIVKNLYTSSVNMKIGGEYAAGVFRLRGGYAYYSKPFAANASAVDASLHNISVGAGFREDNFSLDIAYTHRFAVSEYTPYVIYQNPAPVLVTNNTRQNSIVISAGFRF
jgi:long-subunit fatty acid transport protein